MLIRKYIVLFLLLLPVAILSQELEPRAYANMPKNLNALAIVYGYANGNVLADPSKPIQGLKLTSHNIGVGYLRSFDVGGKLARVAVSLPIVLLSGKATLNGVDTSAVRNGMGDMRIRFGINLIGSPALSGKDFRNYRQRTIVGVSLVTSVPLGQYYKEKLINLGSNRWAFKPELGVSHRFKRVYAEAFAGVWFYTKNNQYLTSKVQEQEPVFTFQTHVCYYFKNQMWLGVNGNWFNGGSTIIDNVPSGDLKDNWRVGATWSIPLAKQHSIKLQAHVGAFTNTGYDYNVVSLAYQYIF